MPSGSLFPVINADFTTPAGGAFTDSFNLDFVDDFSAADNTALTSPYTSSHFGTATTTIQGNRLRARANGADFTAAVRTNLSGNSFVDQELTCEFEFGDLVEAYPQFFLRAGDAWAVSDSDAPNKACYSIVFYAGSAGYVLVYHDGLGGYTNLTPLLPYTYATGKVYGLAFSVVNTEVGILLSSTIWNITDGQIRGAGTVQTFLDVNKLVPGAGLQQFSMITGTPSGDRTFYVDKLTVNDRPLLKEWQQTAGAFDVDPIGQLYASYLDPSLGDASIIIRETGEPDGVVSVVQDAAGPSASEISVCCRYVDNNNRIRAGLWYESSVFVAFAMAIINGVETYIISDTVVTPTFPCTISLLFNDSSFTLSVGGAVVGTGTSTFNVDATKHGVSIYGSTALRANSFAFGLPPVSLFPWIGLSTRPWLGTGVGDWLGV
jgi:hypothetical protein